MTRRILGILLPLAILAGCATVGRDIDNTRVKSIVNNQTTRAEIEQWFGPPDQRGDMSGQPGMPAGLKLERYTYVHSRSLAGIFNSAESLTVIFDDKGIVFTHAFVEN